MMTFNLFVGQVREVYKKNKKRRFHYIATFLLSLASCGVLLHFYPEVDQDPSELIHHPILAFSFLVIMILISHSLWNGLNFLHYFETIIANDLTQSLENSLDDYGIVLLNILSAKILMEQNPNQNIIAEYFQYQEKVHYNKALISQYTIEDLTNTIKKKFKTNKNIITNKLRELVQFNNKQGLFSNPQFNELVLLDLKQKENMLSELKNNFIHKVEIEKQKSLSIEQSLSLDDEKLKIRKYLSL